MTRPALIRLVVLIACIAAVAPARAAWAQGAGKQGKQGRLSQPPATTPGEGPAQISPGEVRRMFDSYALMQAQDALKISNEQFPKFLMQFKALQELRRKTQQEHTRLVQELRKLSAEATPDEAQLKDRLKALQSLDEQAHTDVRKAYEGIDQTLDVRQQARFRVFEMQMEQRMLQLVARARQANRPKQQQPPKQ